MWKKKNEHFGHTVITHPKVCAHFLGQILKAFGVDHVIWGTDAICWGLPQWQIEAFRRFHMPESLQEEFGYPEITDADRRIPSGPAGKWPALKAVYRTAACRQYLHANLATGRRPCRPSSWEYPQFLSFLLENSTLLILQVTTYITTSAITSRSNSINDYSFDSCYQLYEFLVLALFWWYMIVR